MSGTYYKVTPQATKIEGYGFKKVSQEELVEIVSRLTKPTYNSNLEGKESNKVHNFRNCKSAPPPRTPSYCSRRISIGSQSGQISKDKKLTDKEIQRLMRRIRRPTKASERFCKDYVEDASPVNTRPATAASSMPLSGTERRKAFYHLSRPTTASRGKSVLDCHLCTEEDKELNHTLLPFDYPYADDKCVYEDEIGSIISRISYPTRARGAVGCWRSPPDYRSLRNQSEQLPLVSGLERSKTVDQIVNRLHSTKGNNSRRWRCTPKATTVTCEYANA